MILLPDIIFESEGIPHKLSLQDPYTLDEKLITRVFVEREPEYVYAESARGDIIRSISTYNNRIIITNGDNYNVSLDMSSLEYALRRVLNEFFECHNNASIRVGESSRYSWCISRRYDVRDYINDLQRQCDRMFSVTNPYNPYIDVCRERLHEQRRYQTSERERERERYRYSGLFDTEYYGDWFNNSLTYIGNSNQLLNSNRVAVIKTEKKYIHQYNYKPEYIKHYMPDEDTTLLLGCEIEVDCGGESENHAKKVLEIVCGIDPDNPSEALEDKMYCVHDGSLSNGIEFVSMPCSLEYHKKEMKYKEMFEYLDKNGYKAHDTATCGLHIHADRSYLGKTKLMQQLTISKILYILEKFNDEICVIARRDNKYSKFVGEGKNEKSVIELYEKYKNKDKYVALNLKHDASIEFRCFRGTLKYETFILTIEFVKDIIDYAKSVNIEEIELIKWDDLMNTFSDELKEYYNERLKKEKKKENKEEKKSSGSIEFRNGNGILANYDGVGIYNYIADVPRDIRNITFSHEDTERLMHGALLETIQFSQLAASCENTASSMDALRETMDYLRTQYDNAYMSFEINDHTDSNSISTIESKKKEIKSLKKKIKNCNNYMEKRQLNEALSTAQKELKKLKREGRLAS